eukprot:4139641-Prymnesium_polylepis.1
MFTRSMRGEAGGPSRRCCKCCGAWVIGTAALASPPSASRTCSRCRACSLSSLACVSMSAPTTAPTRSRRSVLSWTTSPSR